MRLLVDECTGPSVARWLRAQSHDVFSVYDQSRGMTDDAIFAKAYAESWIIITNDKDFDEKIYREKKSHHGVIFLRLQDERPAVEINAIEKLFEGYSEALEDAFVVVSESQVRFAQG